MTKKTVIGVLLVVFALLYEFYWPDEDKISPVASLWDREITKPLSQRNRIAIGVNSNLDLIVSAVELLESLGVGPSPPNDHQALTTLAELSEVLGYSMLHCAGVERVFTDQALFLEVVAAATAIKHTYHIGGNAALMALKLQQLQPEAEVLLVGPVGSTLRSLLPPSVHTPSLGTKDEVHMILEYSRGAQWDSVTSTCANRVIFSHDLSNSRLVALEEFGSEVKRFEPDLVVLSGAHLLDSQPAQFQAARLQDIAQLLENLPTTLPVHWELATVGDMNYFRQLSNALFQRIDSLGLNEQELRSAAISVGANFTSIPAKPSVGYVSNLLLWLMEEYAYRPNSRLTRVHFHSLTFHIVATVAGGPWSNNRASVMAGARIAGLQACDTHSFSVEKFELRMNYYQTSKYGNKIAYKPGTTASWTRGGIEFELTPVLVCKHPLKTVGLGDAISSVGLLYSQFTRPS